MADITKKIALGGIIIGATGLFSAFYILPRYSYYSANAIRFIKILFLILIIFMIISFIVNMFKSTSSIRLEKLLYQSLEENKLIKINSYAFFMIISVIILIYSGLTIKDQTDFFLTFIFSMLFGIIVTVIQYYKGLKYLFTSQEKIKKN